MIMTKSISVVVRRPDRTSATFSLRLTLLLISPANLCW